MNIMYIIQTLGLYQVGSQGSSVKFFCSLQIVTLIQEIKHLGETLPRTWTRGGRFNQYACRRFLQICTPIISIPFENR